MTADALDAGPHAAALRSLGPDLGGAVLAIQGLLIHGEALAIYGLAPAAFDRTTLTVTDRLSELLADDPRPLSEARSPGRRALGTCRDYAQLVCAAVRAQGDEARIRCGFADYFAPSTFEDHWICEVREGGRWRRVDAQLDDVTRVARGLAFDPTDLPSGRFLDAAQAWRGVRAGQWPAEAFAHGDQASGLWFIRVNVVRDRLAVAGQVTSPWDRWREAGRDHRILSDIELEETDALAADPFAAPPQPPSWAAISQT